MELPLATEVPPRLQAAGAFTVMDPSFQADIPPLLSWERTLKGYVPALAQVLLADSDVPEATDGSD